MPGPVFGSPPPPFSLPSFLKRKIFLFDALKKVYWMDGWGGGQEISTWHMRNNHPILKTVFLNHAKQAKIKK